VHLALVGSTTSLRKFVAPKSVLSFVSVVKDLDEVRIAIDEKLGASNASETNRTHFRTQLHGWMSETPERVCLAKRKRKAKAKPKPKGNWRGNFSAISRAV
jgi:hypothetical protein